MLARSSVQNGVESVTIGLIHRASAASDPNSTGLAAITIQSYEILPSETSSAATRSACSSAVQP